ncbi:hypothetical protein K505DRAFT_375473 [Melanomma pulvis-pyrius CBS 109.77]|uniref:Uncharacterized protein n=1 Tax=Melanomma pulvis-pyrius CBS 109.77 TaxID=1314802 RepID=A0A6A6XB71_9PLEO|nr:hypothetical protein K505DRAFT_375473 [Melanomma pulvis-pyrius CBS 109.77]
MAKQNRRYFLLDEQCLAAEIPRMICRVVEDVQLPLFKYAPAEPLFLAGSLVQQERAHSPRDLIPDILPEASRTTNRKDFLSTVTDKSLQAKVSKIFGLDKGVNDGQKVDLETKEVRRYALNNPGEYFKVLMKDELYARDVNTLLKEIGKAYLIVGFLTTSNATWNRDGSGQSTLEVTGAVPASAIATAAGAPIPQAVDPSFTGKTSASHESNTAHESPDEEIFAVAYAPVKKSGFSFGKTKTVKIGRAKTASASHLAFGESDDEEGSEGIEDDDDDDEVDSKAKDKAGDDEEAKLDEDDGELTELLDEDGFDF